MKTDDLIGMLAQGAGATEPAGDLRRIGLGAALALPVMVAAVAYGLGLVPVADWPISATVPKLAYGLTVALAAVWLLRQAGRPGARVAGPLALVAGVTVLVLAVGVYDIFRLPPEARGMQIMGKSWSACPVLILALSLPLQAGMLWSARLLAPTRLTLAGAAVGLAAGGVATAAYALHCSEGAPAFIAIWYSLGIVLSTLLGALIGPRVLRW